MPDNSKKLDERISELSKVEVFKLRDNHMNFFKRLAYKFFGWYVDSIGETLWETNQKLSVILDELNMNIRILNDENKDLMTENSFLKEKIARLERDYKEIEKKTEECRSRYLKNDDWNKTVNERLDYCDKRFDENNSRFDSANIRLDELFTRCDSQDKRLDENNSRFDVSDKRFDELFKRCDFTNKSLDEHNTRFDSADSRLDELYRRCDNQDIRLDENNARFDSADNRLDELYGYSDIVNKRLDENNLRMDSHDRALDRLNDLAGEFHQYYSYAQSGEDCIVNYILNFLRVDISQIKYLDLGANHPKKMSNSYSLYQKGACGVLVEANPELISELKKCRERDIVLNCVIGDCQEDYSEFYVLTGDGLSTVSYEAAVKVCALNPDVSIKCKYNVPVISVREILQKYCLNQVDVLSIDLEGLELTVLNQLDFNTVRPKIIIFECIDYAPTLVTKKNDDSEITKILYDNEYIEYAFTGINSIYVDKKMVNETNENIRKRLFPENDEVDINDNRTN